MGGGQRRVTEKNWIEEKRENDAILFQLRNILSKHMRENRMRNNLKINGISLISNTDFISINQKKWEKQRGKSKRVENSQRRRGHECFSCHGQ